MKRLLSILLICIIYCQSISSQSLHDQGVVSGSVDGREIPHDVVATSTEGSAENAVNNDDSFDEFYDPFDEFADADNEATGGEYELNEVKIPAWLKSLGIHCMLTYYDLHDYCMEQYQQWRRYLVGFYASLVVYANR